MNYQEAEAIAGKHLAIFDTLDFDVFSNQEWDRLKESHAQDITVYWPDGHMEKGIDQHIESMKKLLVFAPDTGIKEHPFKIAYGEWTSIIGLMESTLPMTMPDGKVVQLTGKAFKLPMCTVGHWENGVMDIECLFWDNATYYKQWAYALRNGVRRETNERSSAAHRSPTAALTRPRLHGQTTSQEGDAANYACTVV